MLVLTRDVGVARLLVDRRDRGLVRGNPHDIRAIVSGADEGAVGRRRPVVDAQLIEVLVGRLHVGKQVLRAAVAKRPAVGAWEQGVQISGNGRVQGDRAPRQNSASRIVIGHGGDTGDSQTLHEPFVCGKEKRAITPNWAAEHRAELVTREVRLRLRRRIEEVARVECGIAMELEHRSGIAIRARSGHGVEDAAGRSPKLG